MKIDEYEQRRIWMQEIIIHNWDELQRAVFDDVWDEKIMRYRDSRIYRGMADELESDSIA